MIRSNWSRSSQASAFSRSPVTSHGVAQAAQNLFEYGTQLIVIIDDENPTFLHPAPICRNVRGENGTHGGRFQRYCTILRRAAFEIYQKGSNK